MRIKEIIGAILMVTLTIIGILLIVGISLISTLNSDGILRCMIKSDYLNVSEKEAENVFRNYLTEDKLELVLNKIGVKSHIREIAESFDNNTVEQSADTIKQDVKNKIINIIDEEISEKDKESFAEIVSNSYIKSIFPVTEFSLLSNVYATYSEKIVLAFCIIAIIFIAIYFYLAFGKKTYKWAIVALYNIVILSVIVVVLLGMLNNITIGNERTTSVIIQIIYQIKLYIILGIILALILAGISNYFAYFKKRKHKK